MRQFALNQAGALTPSTGLLCCHRNTQEENLTHTELSFCNNSPLFLLLVNFSLHARAASRDLHAEQISNANRGVLTPAQRVPFTCAQACLMGRTLFSHVLHKYSVHWLQLTFLKP